MPTKIKKKHGMVPQQWENLCLRCGECCRELFEDKLGDLWIGEVYCDNLIWEEGGKSKCKIYSKRLGYVVGDDIVCVKIEACAHRAQNCPYGKYLPTPEVNKLNEERKKDPNGILKLLADTIVFYGEKLKDNNREPHLLKSYRFFKDEYNKRINIHQNCKKLFHLCDECKKEFATCKSDPIFWSQAYEDGLVAVPPNEPKNNDMIVSCKEFVEMKEDE